MADVAVTSAMDVAISSAGFTTLRQQGGAGCVYSGDYWQTGRFGNLMGSFSCSDGTSGNFQLTEIEAGTHGYFGRVYQTVGNCPYYGHIGGVRSGVPRAAG